MHREPVRRPSPAAVVAIAALALAATPMADAATGKHGRARTPAPVTHARYADEAGRVGGYRASFIPRPNTLLPLGADGRLPSSVLPRGLVAQGGGPATSGPAGPRGPSGLDAPGVVTIVYQANGSSKNPTNGAAEAVCQAGTKVLGGGFNDLTRSTPGLSNSLSPGVDEVQENDPFAKSDGSSGWRVKIVNVQPPGMISSDGKTVVPNRVAPASTYFQSFAICG